MDAEENQKQVFPRRPQPLEIAARFPHSHRRDEAVEVENQKQVFPLSTATGWLFRPNSERRPGGGASLLLQAHCSIRKCFYPLSLRRGKIETRAPVAQLDRAFASGAKGRWFESTRAYHILKELTHLRFIFPLSTSPCNFACGERFRVAICVWSAGPNR